MVQEMPVQEFVNCDKSITFASLIVRITGLVGNDLVHAFAEAYGNCLLDIVRQR